MFVCIDVSSHIILLKSLHVSLHRLWISLLMKFSSKTIKQNTTKNKFIRYLCFIAVDFFHSCHHRLKMSSFSLEKNRFRSIDSDLLAINVTTAFTILNCLEHEFWKNFWPKDDSNHFENSPSFQLSRTWSDILRLDEKFIHQLSAMFTFEMAKVANLVAGPHKCYINRLERFI